MSHATTNAKRLFTRAANTKAPGQRKRLLHLAKQWAARAVETDAERDARVEGEHQQHIVRQEALRILAARHIEDAERARIWAVRQAERYAHETPEQRADRIETETREWRNHYAARDARGIKYGRKARAGSKTRPKRPRVLSDSRKVKLAKRHAKQEARAAKQRERETKRARPSIPPLPVLLPPCPL